MKLIEGTSVPSASLAKISVSYTTAILNVVPVFLLKLHRKELDFSRLSI